LILSSADEIHDLDLIAVSDRRALERIAFEDDEVQFDGYASRIDLELCEKVGDGQWTRQVVWIPVESYLHAVGG
jgi:hypothetical protein